ncbi:unnamed protein product, partial [Mesorhabditis belari]|uniref:Uncharacterized protein n=1 Tax=Mesorhabditis belari TaxID=2138241 RepID=A0AAF3FQT4_9BILA
MDAYITYRYGELNNFTHPSELSGISGRGWYIAGALFSYLLCIYLFIVSYTMRSYIKHSAFISAVLFLPMINVFILVISEFSESILFLKLYHVIVTAEFLTYALCSQILITSLFSVFFQDSPANCTFVYMILPISSLCLSFGLYFVKHFLTLRILTIVVSALPLACTLMTFVLSLVLIFLAAMGRHRDEILTPAVLIFFSIFITFYANWVNFVSTIHSLFGPYSDDQIKFFVMDHPKTPLLAEILHPLLPAVLSIFLFIAFDQFRHPLRFGGGVVIGAFHSQLLIWRARGGSTTEIERLEPEVPPAEILSV